MVDNQNAVVIRDLKVCGLFVPGESKWDIDKVNSLVSNCDAKIILAIPVPKYQVPDRISWLNTIDGKYSVKSGSDYWHKHFSD